MRWIDLGFSVVTLFFVRSPLVLLCFWIHGETFGIVVLFDTWEAFDIEALEEAWPSLIPL